MAVERQSSDESWDDILPRLVRTGKAKGLNHEDAEDCAQEAAIRVVRETPHADAPALGVRAGAALKFAIADERRRSSRKGEIPRSGRVALDADEVREIADEPDLGARLRVMEIVRAVREHVGDDAIRFVLEGEAGYTESESASRRVLHAPSTGSIRKRLSRALPEIARAITDQGEQ